MKNLIKLSAVIWLTVCCLTFFISCQKIDWPDLDGKDDHGHLVQTKIFSSEVAQKWQDLQVRFLRLPAGPNPYGLNGHRYFAYCGIALYEAVVPGMPAYKSLVGQLTDMPVMPSADKGKAYHWAASANAALAFLNRSFFATISDADKASIDSLENALNKRCHGEAGEKIFQRSVNFGKEVAQRIFEWSKNDGSQAVNPPYVPPVGPGLWASTPPNFPGAVAPYWGKNRLLVRGSLDETSSPPPPAYSTDPGSGYYAMVKEVYDISQNLSPADIATALYFRDNPGFQAGTHYVSIFNDIMKIENRQLDYYAVAQAKVGIALHESFIGCWKIKYELNVDRPIRYIREVIGHADWNPLFNTPGHPDFPSGHSQNAGAFSAVFTSLLGEHYSLTLHTYDNLGMAPRSYNSFDEMATDIGKARVFSGIHYTYSCEEGKRQGEKISKNVLNILKFKK